MVSQLPANCLFQNGELHYQTTDDQAISISDIISEIGTPAYIYLSRDISERAEALKTRLDPGVVLKYAVKANPYPQLLLHLSGVIDSFDVASIAELKSVKSLLKPHQISFSGPSKQLHEVKAAVSEGIVFNLESPTELPYLIAAAQSLNKRPAVAIRINTKAVLQGGGLKMGGGASQFGIDEELVPQILSNWSEQLDFVGFHIFGGSQCLSENALAAYFKYVAETVCALRAHLPGVIPTLNVGSGFGIPYSDRDTKLKIDIVTQAFNENIGSLKRNGIVDQVQIEMGRYLVGEAGLFVTKVIDVKRSRGQYFVVCDGGLNHNLAATGNLGQVLRRNYPMFPVQFRADAQLVKANIVGPLCTPIDILGQGIELRLPEIGDLMVVLQSGAYGASASPQAFLSRGPVKEAMI